MEHDSPLQPITRYEISIDKMPPLPNFHTTQVAKVPRVPTPFLQRLLTSSSKPQNRSVDGVCDRHRVKQEHESSRHRRCAREWRRVRENLGEVERDRPRLPVEGEWLWKRRTSTCPTHAPSRHPSSIHPYASLLSSTTAIDQLHPLLLTTPLHYTIHPSMFLFFPPSSPPS